MSLRSRHGLILSSTVDRSGGNNEQNNGQGTSNSARTTWMLILFGVCFLLFYLAFRVTQGGASDYVAVITNDDNHDHQHHHPNDNKNDKTPSLIVPISANNPSDTIVEKSYDLNIDLRSQFDESSDIISFVEFTNETCDNDCGRCWVYNKMKLFLQITRIVEMKRNENEKYQKYIIFIENINDKEETQCNARDITILLRMNGPESDGGIAIADDNVACGWKFEWKVSLSGKYKIAAHLLYYKGYLDFNISKCEYENDKQYKDSSKTEEKVLLKLRSRWRFYGQVEGCCEYCNRMNGKCQSWASGPGDSTRCVLFTHDKSQLEIVDHWEERSKKLDKHPKPYWVSGVYRNEEHGWYLGSLLNIQPNNCHNTKFDLIYGSDVEFTVTMQNNNDNNNNKVYLYPHGNNKLLPFCDSVHSNINSRWVSMSYYDCNNEEMKRWDSLCWIQHHTPFAQYYYLPFDCTWRPQIYSQVKECLKSKGYTKIALAGDSLIRLYSIQVERLIFGKPMRGTNVPNWSYGAQYDYDGIIVYFLGYDDDLDDVSFLEQFLKDENTKPSVIVHNFQIIHKMWHNNSIEISKELPILAKQCDILFEKYYGKDKSKWPARLMLESPMLISEREYHDTADRSIQFNNILRKSMEPHGWISLPVYHMSRARMYDSSNPKDGVVDGMHMSDNLLLEIGRVMLDMLCRFDISGHNVNLNPKYMMTSLSSS